jgi:uncharacterized membrane protein
MRQLIVQVPAGNAAEVMELASDIGATNTARLEAAEEGGENADVVLVDIPNNLIDEFLESLEVLEDFHTTLFPHGVMKFHHPATGPASPIPEASPRSPIEVLLSRYLQESGWWVFFANSAVTGVIVWIGLYEEVIYLLTGAMLVAPFAGPAMNAGVATATGDMALLRHAWSRYTIGIAVTIATAIGLSLLAGMHLPTNLAIEVTSLSSFVLLLPLAAGVAGSLFVINAEETSTVSGAAVSMLVAAAIAPPAGVAGIAIAVGDWGLVGHAAFQLTAQLLGINLVAAIIFRMYKMTPDRPAFTSGRHGIFPITVGATALGVAGLLALQVTTGAPLQQVDIRLEAANVAHAALVDDEIVDLVDVEVRSATTRADSRIRLVLVVRVAPRAAAVDEVVNRARGLLKERLGGADLQGADVLLQVEVVDRVGQGDGS